MLYEVITNWEEALDAADKVAALDPRDVDNLSDLGANTLAFLRRYEAAIERYDEALVLAPDFWEADYARAETWFLWRGRLDSLGAVLRESGDEIHLQHDQGGDRYIHRNNFV